MLIIDVGAFDGVSFSIPYAQDRSHWVYAIEPVPEFSKQISTHALPNLQVVSVAMGNKNTQALLHVDYTNGTASLLPSSDFSTAQDINEQPSDQKEGCSLIEVSVIRLDSFIEANQIAEIDFLNIDVPGHELSILEGLGDAIHIVKRLLIQTKISNQVDENRIELIDFIASQGFRLVIDYTTADKAKESLEFVRVNRFSVSEDNTHFQVEVPYLGKISTPPGDDVGHYLEQGVFEGPEQAFAWLYLRPGDIFFDCGSHVGLFSCIAALKLRNHGHIYGFDPNPECISLYRKNLEQLGCNCFTSRTIGLSDATGSAKFVITEPGKAAFGRLTTGAENESSFEQATRDIQLDTLDNLICEFAIEKVAFVKLDVEGWETFVLLGASQAIQAQKFSVWMVEFTEANALATGSSTQELRGLIEGFGYTLCRFDATNLCLVPEPVKLEYSYQNLFVVLDVDVVNARLAMADTEVVKIAKDIISRWDVATNAAMGLTLIGQNHGQLIELQQAQHKLTVIEQQSHQTLEQVQQQLQETQEKLQSSQVQLQETQEKLQSSQAQLQKTEQQLQQSQSFIERISVPIPVRAYRKVLSKLSRLNQQSLIKDHVPNSLLQTLRDAKDRSNKLTLDQGGKTKHLSLPPHYVSASTKLREFPLISIVTPSYNQASYIERTIESVLSQNYPKLEYIIEDGASSDDTLKILDACRHQIPHIYSQTDTGQGSAINRGFSKSQGEIMAWLNSDDLLLPGSLAYIASYFNTHPDVDVVYGHRILIDKLDRVSGKWVLPPHNEDFILWADYIPQETMFWRRSIWEKSGAYIDESYQFALDWELILRFKEHGAKFVRLPRFIGAFRVYADQKTSSLNVLGQEEMEKLRFRCHKRSVSQEEVDQNIKPYQKQAWKYYWLDRLGFLGH